MLLQDKPLLLTFLKKRCFRHDPDFGFTLASGKKSDFYIDCKPAMLDAYNVRLLGQLLYDLVRDSVATEKIVPPNLVAGVVVGGIPLATAVSIASLSGHRMVLDSMIVRKEAKGHGTGKLIEAPKDTLPRDVVIVEDVITTGGSSLATVRVLREAGFNVHGVFAMVDRLEGGRQALEAESLHVKSIFTRDDFIAPPVGHHPV